MIIQSIFKLIFTFRGNIDSLLKRNDDETTIRKTIHSNYLKILMNYVQILMILMNLKLEWADLFLKMICYQNTISASFFKIISLDCLLKSLFKV